MAHVPGFEIVDGPSYVYEQMAAHVEARIRAGEFAPGARLPNEREMAREYEVSLGTVRSALRLLREAGLVVTRPVNGTFVTEPKRRRK